MPVVRLARALERVLAGAHQLHDRERQVRERVGRGRPCGRSRNSASARELGSGGSASPLSRGERDDPLPSLGRLHHAPDRRHAARPSRKRAIAPFAAIMKSSMSARARLFFVSSIPVTSPSLHHGARFDRLEVERAVLVPAASSAPARRRPAGGAGPATLRSRPPSPGASPCPSSHAPTPSYASLAWFLTAARIDVTLRDDAARDPRPSPRRSARRIAPSPSDVWSVESDSGSIGKIFARRVDRARVLRGVLVDRRAAVHERVDVGDPDAHADTRRRGRRSSDLDLIEVARVVVVDRRPRQMPKITH